jgi:hypothetical protein
MAAVMFARSIELKMLSKLMCEAKKWGWGGVCAVQMAMITKSYVRNRKKLKLLRSRHQALWNLIQTNNIS